jgi:hypothetical protein
VDVRLVGVYRRMGCAGVYVRLAVVTVRVFMVAVILVRLLGTGKAMIWESNDLGKQ